MKILILILVIILCTIFIYYISLHEKLAEDIQYIKNNCTIKEHFEEYTNALSRGFQEKNNILTKNIISEEESIPYPYIKKIPLYQNSYEKYPLIFPNYKTINFKLKDYNKKIKYPCI